ncbi:two-component system regulatory protein YycI [Sutcliffiella cohnii]|uniref:Regulatory protein YycH-like domain-containing protein n=1 Tax=Sutcliffiella cohnii TaxID=33932 RepID=A0A223KWX2_9BACI|nr:MULTISPECIES: two-component system regulatory protein YycI [Sutcliffiella]AST93907.1 hypothetical protein BC6307_22825 [Sutcliffiella cohnii]MED4015748.1 two-component system regulatory protein YycI [Sutcliffiella cohnii]WBL15095.1 two-component system regulatory protein YycI [Sutcliffiella sp. NC1]
MDWRKTKTIFIFTFLILNIFLGYHLVEKRESSQLDIITEASIEEKFEVDEIIIGDIPKESVSASFLGGISRPFSEEDIEILEELGQEAIVIDSTHLFSMFEEPIELTETNLEARLLQILTEHVLLGDQYDLWAIEEEASSITFFQKYDNKFIYRNVGGMVVFNLNEDNHIVSYDQTFIDNIEPMDEPQDTITAIKALENLYYNSELKPSSSITDVELGYYPIVELPNSHILTPTWFIEINGEQDFFVNAFEGQVIKRENRKLE